MQGVKNIIFDLGGVLLNIDYMRTEQAFKDAGIENFHALFSQLNQTPLFEDLEMGKINEDTFVEAMLRAAEKPITRSQVIDAWNAMLLDFPLRRLQLLQQLRLHYNIFLLSNTNSIHEAAFNSALQRNNGIPNLSVVFDKVYFSHRVGLRKPMPEIFQLVLNDNGLQPEQTLFIDDSPQHVVAAGNLGIHTIYLEKGMTVEDDIFKPKATN